MPPLAQRNLFHDKVRLTVTLTGIVFAVVLIVVRAGIVRRLHDNDLEPDRSLGRRSVDHFAECALRGAGSSLQRAQALPGARCAGRADAQKLISALDAVEACLTAGKIPCRSSASMWTSSGTAVESGAGARGRFERPRTPIIMDELYKQKLGVDACRRAVRDRRATGREWLDFTHGIRSFTTSPYVFTTFKNAQNYTRTCPKIRRSSSW